MQHVVPHGEIKSHTLNPASPWAPCTYLCLTACSLSQHIGKGLSSTEGTGRTAVAQSDIDYTCRSHMSHMSHSSE